MLIKIGCRCLLIGLATSMLMGCPAQTVRTITEGVAQSESFSYRYARLLPDSAQIYTLRMNLGRGCADYRFSASDLVNALRTKHFPIVVARTTVSAEFDFTAVEACPVSGQGEVRYETNQLAELVRDSSGNVVGKQRPRNGGMKAVDVGLHSGGNVSALVFGFIFTGTTTSRTNVPGPIDVNAFVVPASQIQDANAEYSNLNYGEALLKDILPNPDRIALQFSALVARVDPADRELLLIWDGDLVLRTDI